MTVQMHDYAAQRTRDGWVMAYVQHGGNSRVHLLNELGNQLRCFDLASSLPDFSRFAHWTTAGMAWCEQMLAYFTAEQRHFVVGAWWGARLVIDLKQLGPISPRELADELHRTECDIVLQGLRQLAAELESGRQPEYGGPSTDTIRCTVGTIAHFPGLLGLVAAVPLLRVLEERLVGWGECWSSFHYHMHTGRKFAQISLRRLGEKPRGFPALTFSGSEKRAALRQPQLGPIDGRTRHANLSRISRSTPLAKVYQLLGSPDEIGRGKQVDFWRYDVDVDPPYTVLLWLAKNDRVTRIVRYLPPFWTGPDVFPSREHSLIGSDGTTVGAYTDELDGMFIGTRIEVNMLQELATSGRDPVAPLALAVLDGDYAALGPLADAMEEAGDPGTAQVRAWSKK